MEGNDHSIIRGTTAEFVSTDGRKSRRPSMSWPRFEPDAFQIRIRRVTTRANLLCGVLLFLCFRSNGGLMVPHEQPYASSVNSGLLFILRSEARTSANGHEEGVQSPKDPCRIQLLSSHIQPLA
jgi:hypothetical protein